jgi:hypothetical protein
MDLFVLDKIIITAITQLIHSPVSQFSALVVTFIGSMVLFPEKNKSEKQ